MMTGVLKKFLSIDPREARQSMRAVSSPAIFGNVMMTPGDGALIVTPPA